MANYDPNCSRCLRCMTCRGNGTIRTTRSGQRGNGTHAHWYETATCPTCSGRGVRACGRH